MQLLQTALKPETTQKKLFREICPCAHVCAGSRWNKNLLQFGLPARDTSSVIYCFFHWTRPLEPGDQLHLLEKVVLDPKIHLWGDLWGWEAELHPRFNKLNTLAYLIAVEKTDGRRRWIIDPFSRASDGGSHWNRPVSFELDPASFRLHTSTRPHGPVFTGTRRVSILHRHSSVKRHIDSPGHDISKCIVYECHVRGMTRHTSSPALAFGEAGTFRALAGTIPHLCRLGVNTVELLPVFDFDENESSMTDTVNGRSLLNYWGYSPLQFFAVKQNYAANLINPEQEFREMVDAFHKSGIEVWLDVVFNHTAELGSVGPIDHFKWIGKEVWYLLDEQGGLQNHSGCGNTLRCTHPAVQALIRDSLRYWANEMGVDGFRFDLAPILDRDGDGALRHFPDLLWSLRNDPALTEVKLIAEPWDAGGAYRLGEASRKAGWAEWNDQFRDSVRQAVRGDEGVMGKLKQAILGSPGIFGSVREGRRASINYITAHDGLTLNDLVSFNHKHNEANGEGNRDGHNTEFSSNCGVEGETRDTEVLALRRRKIRLMHFLLQVSNGIPMLLAGDEIGRTQGGNNNAYCHDSPIAWIDWELCKTNEELLDFTGRLIAFRKQHFEFLFDDQSSYRWFSANGGAEFLEPFVRTLCWEVKHAEHPGKSIRFLVNCFDHPVEFSIGNEGTRKVVIETSEQCGEWGRNANATEWLQGFSALVLVEGF